MGSHAPRLVYELASALPLPRPPTPLERRLLLSELHTGRDRDEFSLSVERKQLVFVEAAQISVITVGSAFAGETLLPVFKERGRFK